MGFIEPEFEAKMRSIGFRANRSGLAMTANVSGVEVTAIKSPIAIHLTFTQVTARKSTQYEVQIPSTAVAAWVAAIVVENMEKNFSGSGNEEIP